MRDFTQPRTGFFKTTSDYVYAGFFVVVVLLSAAAFLVIDPVLRLLRGSSRPLRNPLLSDEAKTPAGRSSAPLKG